MEFGKNSLECVGRQLSDSSSVLLAGNIELYSKDPDDSLDDDVVGGSYFNTRITTEDTVQVNVEDVCMNDILKCEQMFENQTGVYGTLRKLVKLIIDGQVHPSEILMQALSYKVQMCSGGKFSVRYNDSYGMFWAGVRNLQKSRSLIVFKEHFPIPSNLSRMSKKIIDICGLDPNSIGKSGLQTQSLQLWIDAKLKESSPNSLGVSISIDGKRVDAENDGIEDMAGVGDSTSKSDEMKRQQKILADMDSHVDLVHIDRASCFKLYDKLTEETGKLVSKLTNIHQLMVRNSKQLDKNPGLARYLYVLEQKKIEGTKLLRSIQKIQINIIIYIASDRNCLDPVLPDIDQYADLGFQSNYYTLKKTEFEDNLIQKIESFALLHTRNEIDWHKLQEVLETVPLSTLSRDSKFFQAIYDLCLLHDTSLYRACGLSKLRPLAEMKEIYWRSRNVSASSEVLGKVNINVIASFCAYFSPVTFGNNFVIREGGFFLNKGRGCSPDLVVVNSPESDEIIFTVKAFEVEVQTFHYTEEMLTISLASATISNAAKGCLMVVFSKDSLVVFNVSRNDDVVEAMFRHVESYLNTEKCLTKRTSEMIESASLIQKNIEQVSSKIVALGSYPVVTNASETQRLFQLKKLILKPNRRINPIIVMPDKEMC